MHTDIHNLSGIRTYDPSVRSSEDCSGLRPRGAATVIGISTAMTVCEYPQVTKNERILVSEE
jgi:hypothetical protein